MIYLTGYSEFEYARKALDQRAFAYVLKGEGDDVIVKAVARALGETESGHLDAVVEKQEEPTVQPWVSELIQYIEEHIDSSLSLQSLADHTHLHPVYLSRAFKEATGKTVGDYVGAVRL